MFNFLFFKVGIFFANILPLKLCNFIAIRIADVYRLFRKEDICNVTHNLKAITNKEGSELDRCVKDVFRNFALYLIDFLRLKSIDKEFIKNNVTIEGLEYFKDELKRNRGLIGITAHIGNWELLGVIMSELGFKVNAIALGHKSSLVNRIFISQRNLHGVKVLEMGNFRDYLRVFRNNEVLAVLGDRDFSNSSVDVDFFDKQAEFPKGPAVLALRTGARLLPGFLIRESSNKFKIFFYKPIESIKSGILDNDIADLTSKYALVLEEVIRRYPSQWLVFKQFYKS